MAMGAAPGAAGRRQGRVLGGADRSGAVAAEAGQEKRKSRTCKIAASAALLMTYKNYPART